MSEAKWTAPQIDGAAERRRRDDYGRSVPVQREVDADILADAYLAADPSALRTQRDELLAALTRLVAACHRHREEAEWYADGTLDEAERAIREATQGVRP